MRSSGDISCVMIHFFQFYNRNIVKNKDNLLLGSCKAVNFVHRLSVHLKRFVTEDCLLAGPTKLLQLVM